MSEFTEQEVLDKVYNNSVFTSCWHDNDIRVLSALFAASAKEGEGMSSGGKPPFLLYGEIYDDEEFPRHKSTFSRSQVIQGFDEYRGHFHFRIGEDYPSSILEIYQS